MPLYHGRGFPRLCSCFNCVHSCGQAGMRVDILERTLRTTAITVFLFVSSSFSLFFRSLFHIFIIFSSFVFVLFLVLVLVFLLLFLSLFLFLLFLFAACLPSRSYELTLSVPSQCASFVGLFSYRSIIALRRTRCLDAPTTCYDDPFLRVS